MVKGVGLSYFFVFFLHLWNEVLRGSHGAQRYLRRKVLPLDICSLKMKALIAFLISKHDPFVKRCISNILKISEEQEIPIEEWRFTKKKKCLAYMRETKVLSSAEEIKQCMLEAVNQFRNKSEKMWEDEKIFRYSERWWKTDRWKDIQIRKIHWMKRYSVRLVR